MHSIIFLLEGKEIQKRGKLSNSLPKHPRKRQQARRDPAL